MATGQAVAQVETIVGTDTTTQQLAMRSSDTNWYTYLGQLAPGGTLCSVLSAGGLWTVNGSGTFAATKNYNGSFPTAAFAICNEYNSSLAASFRFLRKAGGSTTTDGTVSELARINDDGTLTVPAYACGGVGGLLATDGSGHVGCSNEVRCDVGYGAVGDNSTNNTTSLNNCFSYAASNNKIAVLPAGQFKFDTCLTARTGSNWGIRGAGGFATQLIYTGTSTTCDLLVFGDGSNDYRYLTLSGFTIVSNSSMTAGTAIHLRRYGWSTYTDLNVCPTILSGGTTAKCWNGIWFDNVQWSVYSIGNVSGHNDCVRVNTGAELSLDQVRISDCANDGILVGGGFGGFYTGYISVNNAKFGLWVDQSLDATLNRELFLGPHTIIDNSSQQGIHLNDSAGGTFKYDGWVSSNAHEGLYIENWSDIIELSGSFFASNNGSDAIYVAVSAPTLKIGDSARIKGNGGWGVNCAVATSNVLTNSRPNTNSSGDFAANCRVESNADPGFRKGADGWVEQWGTGVGGDTVVTLPWACNIVPTVTATITDMATGTNSLFSVHISAVSTTAFTGRPRYATFNFGTGTVTAGGITGGTWNWRARCR